MPRRIAGALAVIALVASPLLTSTAGAQAGAVLQASLVGMSPWVGPQDTLIAALEVSNLGQRALSNLRVTVSVHQGITTRSQLERTFRGAPGPVEVSDTVLIEGSLPAGERRTVTVDKQLSEFRFFQAGPPDRVYPVRFTVRGGALVSRPVDSHMIYFARPPELPLATVLVVPLHAPTVYDESLAIISDDLRGQIGGGRITEILDALEAHAGAPVTLAPSGLLLETLSSLSDGYTLSDGGRVAATEPPALRAAQALGKLRSLASRDNVSLIGTPYSNAHPVWLVQSGMADQAQEQASRSRLEIERTLSRSPLEGWFLPPLGAVDEPTLSALRRSEASRFIVSPSSVRGRSTPLTEATPTRIAARGAPLTALVADAGLERRLSPSRELSPVQARQQFLAETATIMLERPAQRRVVVAVAAVDWNPGDAFLRGILGALSESPWMRGVTPDQALAEVPATGSKQPATADSVLATLPDAPPQAFEARLSSARAAIDDYARLGPPEARIGKLEQKLLIAQSSDWWASRRGLASGESFARAITDEVGAEMGKIRAPRRQTITLTSRTGVIPLVLSTATDYPVTVVLTLQSDKLRFPDGTRLEHRLEPPADTLDVQVVAETSGTFPVRILLETPDGARTLGETIITVRSTAYNVVALATTVGAGLFLMMWWLVGASRRRLAAASGSA